MAPRPDTISDLTDNEIIRQALAGAGNHDDMDSSRAGVLGWERAEELLKDLERKHFGSRLTSDAPA